ncbi:MAG: DUF1858 domain-containing protein [Balneolaceae bacterium]
MNQVYPKQKIADVLENHPQTYCVFREHECPDMRSGFFSYMAKMMSIRNAARIHRIPEDRLLSDLRESIQMEEAGN